MKRHVGYAMRLLGGAFPSWYEKIDEDRAEVWSRVLEDIDPQALAAATLQHIRTSPYPPTPAHIIRLAKPGSDPVIAAAECWEALRAKANGSERAIAGPHSASAYDAAKRAVGGALALRSMTTKDFPFTRNLFVRVYVAKAKQEEEGAARADVIALMAGQSDRLAALPANGT